MPVFKHELSPRQALPFIALATVLFPLPDIDQLALASCSVPRLPPTGCKHSLGMMIAMQARKSSELETCIREMVGAGGQDVPCVMQPTCASPRAASCACRAQGAASLVRGSGPLAERAGQWSRGSTRAEPGSSLAFSSQAKDQPKPSPSPGQPTLLARVLKVCCLYFMPPNRKHMPAAGRGGRSSTP